MSGAINLINAAKGFLENKGGSSIWKKVKIEVALSATTTTGRAFSPPVLIDSRPQYLIATNTSVKIPTAQ